MTMRMGVKISRAHNLAPQMTRMVEIKMVSLTAVLLYSPYDKW